MGSRFRFGLIALLMASVVVACGWDLSHPFERDAPAVKDAIKSLDAGDPRVATALLENYLTTGECKDGNIGISAAVREKPQGSFDLTIALFRLSESFGKRFGEEEIDAGLTPEATAQRSAQIDCALRVAQAIATSDKTPVELQANARYLEGNLHFLAGDYEEAVRAYDQSLTLDPGMNDAGDPVGRDAAWNRAIAMRRIDDKKDAGQDASSDATSDAPSDANRDAAGDSGSGNNDGGGGGPDGGDSGSKPDSGADSQAPPPPAEDAGPPPPSKSQDDRMLDQLENAPTVQQEAAKKQAQQRHRATGMADK